jgi:hypothetical protein
MAFTESFGESHLPGQAKHGDIGGLPFLVSVRDAGNRVFAAGSSGSYATLSTTRDWASAAMVNHSAYSFGNTSVAINAPVR